MRSKPEPGSGSPPKGKPSSVSQSKDLAALSPAKSATEGSFTPGSADREKYLAEVRAEIERTRQLAEDFRLDANSKLVPGDLKPFLRFNKGPVLPETTQPSILHIDDDAETLTLVRQILTEAGYIVVSAQSGFEGVDQFRRRPYDFSIVITDLTMPLMDGEETFLRLREIRPDVPVILATGFIQEERLTHLKSVGLAGFLRKPIPPDEIVSTIRVTLETARYYGITSSDTGAIAL